MRVAAQARDCHSIDCDALRMVEEVLQGGVANAGAVVRDGAVVLRPASAHVGSIHALLTHMRRAAPGIAPQPLGLGSDGRERLAFIDGEVPHPPYPAWSQTDAVLATSAMLLRRYHDAVCDFAPPDGATWSEDLADPGGGTLIC